MKVVILAGGLGTRLSEETGVRPKPMVEVGERPILWHIMSHYAHYGFRDFYITLGYRGDQIKRYMLEYHAMSRDLTISLRDGVSNAHDTRQSDDWTVHLIDTGLETATGGRLKRLEPHLRDETFMLTYGDGVSNVDLLALLEFHRSRGRAATITAVRPPARFGALLFEGDRIREFQEKPQIGEGWINGGFMVFEPSVFRFLDGDATSLEADALEGLSSEGQLSGYRHEGFWQCMDTLRELRLLERLWHDGTAPWKVWR